MAALEGTLIGFALGHAGQRDTGKHFDPVGMCMRLEQEVRSIGKRLLEGLEAELKAQRVGKIYLLIARGGPTAAF